MTFIINANNIRQVGEETQKDNVATLIIMTNIIRYYDSV
jgi:hypothetical protein